MNWYEQVKLLYDWGFYTNEQVYLFVGFSQITKEQADEITGKTTD